MTLPQHIPGQTWHGRRGAVGNAFRYGVDYLLIDPESKNGPRLFSRDRANLFSIRDRDHGGPPGQGRGLTWVREQLAEAGIAAEHYTQVLLLAQPRVLGHVFNPVSFWLCFDAAGALRLVIAEVTNTYGDRHSYLCHRPDHAPLTKADELSASKVFHVSPFQPLSGDYRFRFDIQPDRIGIWINLVQSADTPAAPQPIVDTQSSDVPRTSTACADPPPSGGLIATLTGPRLPLTNRAILRACLHRPFGSRRVLGLIHWQAVKLWWKGARWHVRPTPPRDEISR